MNRIQKGTLCINKKFYPIYEGHNTIGRSPNATIIIRDLKISHNHAIITIVDNKHFVSEISACNGTYLNEEKLLPLVLYEIPNNAVIKFGSTNAIYSSTQTATSSSDTQNYSESFFEAPTQLLDISKSCNTNICINDMPTQVLNGQDIHQVLANDSTISIHDLPTQPILQEDKNFDDSAISGKFIDETKCDDFNDADSNDSLDLMTMQQPAIIATQKEDVCNNQDRDSPLHTSQLHRKISRAISSGSDTDDEKSNESEILKNKSIIKPLLDSSDDETDIEDMKLDKNNKNNLHNNSDTDETDAETDGNKENVDVNKSDNLNDSDFIPATQEPSKSKGNVGTSSLGDSFHLHLTELTSTEKNENSDDSSNQESMKRKSEYSHSQNNNKEEPSVHMSLEKHHNNESQTNSTIKTSSQNNSIKNTEKQIENSLMNSEKQNEDIYVQITNGIICENEKVLSDSKTEVDIRNDNREENKTDCINTKDVATLTCNKSHGEDNEEESDNIYIQQTQITVNEEKEMQNHKKTNAKEVVEDSVDKLDKENKTDDDIYLQATQLLVGDINQVTDEQLMEAADNASRNEIINAKINTIQAVSNEDPKNIVENDNDVYLQSTQKIDHFENASVDVSDNIERENRSTENVNLSHNDDQFKKPSSKVRAENIFLAPTQKIESLEHDVYSQPTQIIHEENDLLHPVENDDIFLQPTQLISAVDVDVNRKRENDIFLQPTQIITSDNGSIEQSCSDVESKQNVAKICADIESQLEVMFSSQSNFNEADNSRPMDPVASTLSISETVNTEVTDAASNDIPSCSTLKSTEKRNTRKKSVTNTKTDSTKKRQKRKLSVNQSKDDNSGILQSVSEVTVIDAQRDNNSNCEDKICERDEIDITISTRSRRVKSKTVDTNTKSEGNNEENTKINSISSSNASERNDSLLLVKKTLTRGQRAKLASFENDGNENEVRRYSVKTKGKSENDGNECEASISGFSATKDRIDANESDSSSNVVKETPKRGKRTKSKATSDDRNENEASTSCYSVQTKGKRTKLKSSENDGNESEASTSGYTAQTRDKKSTDAGENDSSSNVVKKTLGRNKHTKSKSSDNDRNKNEATTSYYSVQTKGKRTKLKSSDSDGNESEASTSGCSAQTKIKRLTDADESSSSSNATPRRGKRTKLSDDGNESETSSSSYAVQTKRTKTSILNETSLLSTPQRNKRKLKPKVVFTMFESPEMEMLVRRLGGSLVDTAEACTVLITKCVKRSQKLLSAVGQGKPICSPSWLEACKKANQFLDPWDYIIKDEEAETKWEFSLEESLQRSSNQKLLTNYKFLILVTTACDVLKGAIEACDGKCVSKAPPKSFKGNFVVISTKNKSENTKYKKQGVPVVEAEAIFDGVLRQKLELQKHLL